METEAWTIRLGRELQSLGAQTTDSDYNRLNHELRQAISDIKFIRKCYNKEPAGDHIPQDR
ncbi:hypothetical protein SCRES2_gp50 [Synechococcus phage S-CRES2]|nr:hypothetical protein SCRES1_gp45 [Synechococcus phage S-CRES1]WGL30589.1 hypothetical protein SCRES2_gp50 [Synechococcus phage S-CRES2]